MRPFSCKLALSYTSISVQLNEVATRGKQWQL